MNRTVSVIQRTVHFILIGTIAQLIRNNGIEIRRVRSKTDLWDVRSCLGSQPSLKIQTVKVWMCFELCCTSPTKSLFRSCAQTDDQISSFR